VASTLKSGLREGTYQRSRARGALLIAQGALSMVLLVGRGCSSEASSTSARSDWDSTPERLLIVRRNLRGADMSDSAQAQLGRQLLAACADVFQVSNPLRG
jgi:hypothetical protein